MLVQIVLKRLSTITIRRVKPLSVSSAFLAAIWASPSWAAAGDPARTPLGIEAGCLLAATALLLFLPTVYANLGGLAVGIPTILGNRENYPGLPGWLGRMQRAHLNLVENLLPFAVVAILVQITGVSNSISQTGAIVFLAARIAHAVIYSIGVPGLRSLAFLAGLVGLVMTAAPLLAVLP